MFLVQMLRKEFNVNGLKINTETEDVAGYIVVYKTKEAAEKQAKEFGCDVAEVYI
jgi:hypothetical protein